MIVAAVLLALGDDHTTRLAVCSRCCGRARLLRAAAASGTATRGAAGRAITAIHPRWRTRARAGAGHGCSRGVSTARLEWDRVSSQRRPLTQFYTSASSLYSWTAELCDCAHSEYAGRPRNSARFRLSGAPIEPERAHRESRRRVPSLVLIADQPNSSQRRREPAAEHRPSLSWSAGVDERSERAVQRSARRVESNPALSPSRSQRSPTPLRANSRSTPDCDSLPLVSLSAAGASLAAFLAASDATSEVDSCHCITRQLE